jgi:hypothetical protein
MNFKLFTHLLFKNIILKNCSNNESFSVLLAKLSVVVRKRAQSQKFSAFTKRVDYIYLSFLFYQIFYK